jgi:uncharacterized protein
VASAPYANQFPYMERGLPATGPPGGRACRGASRSRGCSWPAPERKALRRGTILRRPHNIAGPGSFTPPWRARGVVFFAFPLHPAGRASIDRANHLSDVHVPMLFLQGTRDDMAQPHEMQGVCERLGERVTLKLLDEADHAFRVPARFGRSNADILNEMLDCAAEWMTAIVGR